MACSLSAERLAMDSSSLWAVRMASSSSRSSFSGFWGLRLKEERSRLLMASRLTCPNTSPGDTDTP